MLARLIALATQLEVRFKKNDKIDDFSVSPNPSIRSRNLVVSKPLHCVCIVNPIAY